MIIKELYPRIMVFRDALNNIDDFAHMLRNGSEFVNPWEDWYTLGKQTKFTSYGSIKTDKFPSIEEWNSKFENLDNLPAKQVLEIFYNCTKIYVDKYEVDIPNWLHPAPYILSHSVKNNDHNLTMHYHTDFIISQTHNPGFKFWITGLLYVNDNYEGGEIAFKIFDEKNHSTDSTKFDHFSYKPKAGDFLVMPSHHPYYHGVKKTTTNNKLFIRMFWGYDYPGSKEWLENEQRYGKELWAQMERERLESENGKWFKGAVEEPGTSITINM